MTATTSTRPPNTPRRWLRGRALRDGNYLYWWREALGIAVFYAVYTYIRNASPKNPRAAFLHATQVIDLEKTLGIYHEQVVNHWASGIQPIVIASNYFYGSMHFVVTIIAAIFLYRNFPDDYPIWRNTIAIATSLALIVFVTWPLEPPRLLPDSYGYLDTLAKYPTLWTFNSGAMKSISNQYAAMPSVHCAWALWCACVLVPRVKHSWLRWVAALYPVATVVVIELTANHFILDAVGGFAALGVGYAGARLIANVTRSRFSLETRS